MSSGRLRGERRVISARGLLIGRHGEVDLALEETPVSRRHARVERRDDGFVLTDLGSKNGSFLRGVVQGRSETLRDGDRFRIGKTEILFFDPEALPPDLASGAETRRAPRVLGDVVYSSGRVEGRGLLFDLSATDARVLDVAAKLRLASPARLVLPDLPGLKEGTFRGKVVGISPSGFAVRFDGPAKALREVLA